MSGRINTYTTLSEATTALKEKGFTAEFSVNEDACLIDTHDHSAYSAEKINVVEFHRFEGPSDPADEAVVYALVTPFGTRGILIDAFGPESDPHVDTFIKGLHITHDVQFEPKHEE
jgi:hypothetical protein